MVDKPTVSISSVTFSSGQVFEFGPQDKVILVGPNNSGKSQFLRDMVLIASRGKSVRSVVLQDIGLYQVGSAQELEEFLKENATPFDGGYRYRNWQIADGAWNLLGRNHLSDHLISGFVKNISADDRLRICDEPKHVARDQQKSKPQHVLYDSETQMAKISALFKEAFGRDLLIDFRGGLKIPIHVGDPPDSAIENKAGDEYVDYVRSYPKLADQGDGIKSYAGILFEALVTSLDVTLIDEPEAFLHPPQMRKLGHTLASEVSGQLFVATHSSDVMRGFLEGTKGNVRILRIRREGDVNRVSKADAETVEELWSTPALRYSNALDGVFHEQAILCEDHSDCRLINAVADHLETVSGERWKDTAYVPTGGKHAIPKIANVLRKVGVPTKAVIDLDFIREMTLVRDTVNAFGGNWTALEPIWRRVQSAIDNSNALKSSSQIKREIIAAFENTEDEMPSKATIVDIFDQRSPWHIVKKAGEAGLPSGNASSDYQALKDSLSKIGIYLVPVGEIEGFCKSIGGHGRKFVTTLMDEIPLDDDRLRDLREFVETVHSGAHSILDEPDETQPAEGLSEFLDG